MYRRQGPKSPQRKRNARWSEEALQIAEKRREVTEEIKKRWQEYTELYKKP